MATIFNSTGTGYNISCDPGTLYNRKCYVNVHNPPGCDPADPACTVTQQEIIGYTSKGDPISKAPSDASWIAWVPTLTTLDESGTAYQPYGEAGLPYGSGVIPTSAGTTDVSGSGVTSSSSTTSADSKPEVSDESVTIPEVVGGIALFTLAAYGLKSWYAARGGKLF
jgi:hypothetical protein